MPFFITAITRAGSDMIDLHTPALPPWCNLLPPGNGDREGHKWRDYVVSPFMALFQRRPGEVRRQVRQRGCASTRSVRHAGDSRRRSFFPFQFMTRKEQCGQ